MSRLQIRRIIAALVLVAALIPALPGRAEAAGYSNVTQSGVAQLWNEFVGWLLGKGDLPPQAQGHRNGPPESIPPDTDKGSGIDPNGGGGNGGGGNGSGN